MRISQKCYYALKAIFELSKQDGTKPLPVPVIAEEYKISTIFLHMILRELKQGGFVESRRGKEGGYVLTRKPENITLGEVIRFIEGNLELVDCSNSNKSARCEKNLTCPFSDVWKEGTEKLNNFFDGITFKDLVKKEKEKIYANVIDYSI